jgi:hypothetical protein
MNMAFPDRRTLTVLMTTLLFTLVLAVAEDFRYRFG